MVETAPFGGLHMSPLVGLQVSRDPILVSIAKEKEIFFNKTEQRKRGKVCEFGFLFVCEL